MARRDKYPTTTSMVQSSPLFRVYCDRHDCHPTPFVHLFTGGHTSHDLQMFFQDSFMDDFPDLSRYEHGQIENFRNWENGLSFLNRFRASQLVLPQNEQISRFLRALN